MKSYWIVTKGRQATLERREVPIPQPQPGQIVISVRASALNRGELFVGGVVHGGPEKLGGNEAAGVVHAVGAGVTHVNAGEEVMGRARGAFADYAILERHQVLRKPPRLSWEQAAATPLSFITAYEAVIQYGRLTKGEWMLVTGASAGTGVAAIQIAQVVGARV